MALPVEVSVSSVVQKGNSTIRGRTPLTWDEIAAFLSFLNCEAAPLAFSKKCCDALFVNM